MFAHTITLVVILVLNTTLIGFVLWKTNGFAKRPDRFLLLSGFISGWAGLSAEVVFHLFDNYGVTLPDSFHKLGLFLLVAGGMLLMLRNRERTDNETSQQG